MLRGPAQQKRNMSACAGSRSQPPARPAPALPLSLLQRFGRALSSLTPRAGHRTALTAAPRAASSTFASARCARERRCARALACACARACARALTADAYLRDPPPCSHGSDGARRDIQGQPLDRRGAAGHYCGREQDHLQPGSRDGRRPGLHQGLQRARGLLGTVSRQMTRRPQQRAARLLVMRATLKRLPPRAS